MTTNPERASDALKLLEVVGEDYLQRNPRTTQNILDWHTKDKEQALRDLVWEIKSKGRALFEAKPESEYEEGHEAGMAIVYHDIDDCLKRALSGNNQSDD